jgi:ribosomal protein S27E
MSWWDLGEGSGYSGDELATYRIACAFCGEKGNFETAQHLERKKAGVRPKVLNYDTLKCGHCGNYMFVFWSASTSGSLHSYEVLPWHQSTTDYPEHWPPDIGRYWVEARRSIEGKN